MNGISTEHPIQSPTQRRAHHHIWCSCSCPYTIMDSGCVQGYLFIILSHVLDARFNLIQTSIIESLEATRKTHVWRGIQAGKTSWRCYWSQGLPWTQISVHASEVKEIQNVWYLESYIVFHKSWFARKLTTVAHSPFWTKYHFPSRNSETFKIAF